MAQPWKHPDTGVYYLRRQVPEAIRSAFGGKALWKASLKTKDFARAAILFAQANAELERRFDEARTRLAATGDARPSQRDRADELVQSYFVGEPRTEGGLDGPERLLLARLEVDRGLWDATPTGCVSIACSSAEDWWALAGNTALFRGHASFRRNLPPGNPPGSVWRWADGSFAEGARAAQVARVVEQIRRHHDLDEADMPDGVADAVAGFFDRQPIASTRDRKPRSATSRARPEMRLLELFAAWQDKLAPGAQCVHEYRQSVVDFIDFVGDIGIGGITNDDLLDYRDEVEKLPRSMPRADRALSFTERVRKHGGTGARLSPASVKKRVGAMQAMLSFAKDEKYLSKNEGRDVPVAGAKSAGKRRITFQDEDLQRLLASSLFSRPATWRSDRRVSHVTLYWLFLLGLTTGARLEEVGQAAVADVKRSGKIRYIDVDDYVEDPSAGGKSVKTDSSRRLIPIHDHLLALGFEPYLAALTMAGHTQLFPDLEPAQFGKRTKEASRTANRLIDKEVSKDARLVFHSSRHGFKDLATEAGIPTRTVDQMCGHAPTSVGGRYGSGVRLNALHRELHRIEWSFIDWDALGRAVADLDWSKIIRPREG